MSASYEDPSSGTTSGGRPADIEGHDVVVVTHEIKMMDTVHGETAAAVVSIFDATDEEVYPETLWFNKVLVGTCGRAIGKPIIGTIAKGVASKPGFSAPWILSPIDDAERKAEVIAWAEDNGVLDEIAAVAVKTGQVEPAAATAKSKPAAAKSKASDDNDSIPF